MEIISLVEPLQKHVENVLAFRKTIETFENKDYDKLLAVLGTPIVKKTVYNTGNNFVDIVGGLIKRI